MGMTALHYAARAGHIEASCLLISRGATVCRGSEGLTPLMAAANQGHAKVCSILIQQDPDINQTDDKGRTALHWAVSGGSRGTINILLDEVCFFYTNFLLISTQEKELSIPSFSFIVCIGFFLSLLHNWFNGLFLKTKKWRRASS